MTFTVALVRDVFIGPDSEARLARRLHQAKALGAELAVLPEIPLNPWSPAAELPREEDAELPEGPRHVAMSAAAKSASLGLVGGAIVVDPKSGLRHNTALVFDARGTLISSYRKIHLPDEQGFWETRHYEPGDQLPSIVE